MAMIQQPEKAPCKGDVLPSRPRRHAFVLGLVLSLSLLGTQGCAGMSWKRRDVNDSPSEATQAERSSPDSLESSEQMPDENAESENAETATATEPVIRPAVLVFGPGQARALATLGILQAWGEAGLPLAEIYASETSALVAALHASSRTASETEWKLLKIRSDCFVRESSILDGIFSRGQDSQCIEDSIDSTFGTMGFRDLRVPLRVGYEEADGSVVWTNTGSVAAALKNSYRSAALHGAADRPHSIRDGSAFPISRIRAMFSGPVVAIDYSTASGEEMLRGRAFTGTRGPLPSEVSARLPEAESAYEKEIREVTDRSLDSLKEADLSLRPFAGRSALRLLEHRRRPEAIATGRAALEDNLDILSTLTGVTHE